MTAAPPPAAPPPAAPPGPPAPPAPARAPAVLVAAALLAAVPAFPSALAAQAPPPDEDWRQLPTEHFIVTYPAPLEPLARRAGAAAERAWVLLAERFVDVPDTPVQLLLTDHADISNGVASPLPYNRITVFARPPVGGGSISYFDDWLELVVTHELVHTFHLDMAGWLGGAIRKVFGRAPAAWPVFPSGSSPTWFLEGLATYFESELTGAGRVKGTWQEMVMRAAALEDGLDPLPRVSGDSPVWPGGHRPYVYGARFLDHMADARGEEALADFARSVAGLWIPYRMNAAARDAFGVGVRRSWDDWSAGVEAGYRALPEQLARWAPLTEGEAVDRAGRLAEQAVVSPDGAALAFARSDGVDATQIRVAAPDGSGARRLTRVNGLGGSLSWAPDGSLLFTQLDFTDRYRIAADLYRAGLDGAVERITRGRRISHADAAPDGRRAVAVQEGGGTSALVIVDLETGAVDTLAAARPDRHWASPRWSPDGTRIAAVRWDAPALTDIVVLYEDGGLARQVTRDRAVDTSPFWAPDGSTLVWSSDRTGIPNLFSASLGAPGDGDGGDGDGGAGPERAAGTGAVGALPEVRQITNMLGGAAHPSVDPAGRWLYFSSYHADGWHVERIPYRPGEWFEPQPTSERFADAPAPPAAALDEEAAAALEGAEPRPYSPWRTLRPYAWSPRLTAAEKGTAQSGRAYTVLEPAAGFSISGADLVGRHAYSLSARLAFDASRFEGGAGYSYRGLGNPVLGLALSQSHDASSRTAPVRYSDGTVQEFFVVERERAATASMSLVRRRYRSWSGLSLAGSYVRERLSLQDLAGAAGPELVRPPPLSSFADLRATVSAGNAQRRAHSFSREDGLRGFVSGRLRRHAGLDADSRGAVGADRSYGEVVGELSAFKSLWRSGFANHVLALRFSGGAASGPGADRSHFDVGDAEGRPEPLTGLGLFGGSSRLFPVRGYRANYRSGRFAWSASAEYRFPLADINGGPDFAPLFFDRLHGSVFLDAGNAWGPVGGDPARSSPRRPALAAAGAELSLIAAPVFAGGFGIRFGAGFPLAGGDGPQYYLRVGNSF